MELGAGVGEEQAALRRLRCAASTLERTVTLHWICSGAPRAGARERRERAANTPACGDVGKGAEPDVKCTAAG